MEGVVIPELRLQIWFFHPLAIDVERAVSDLKLIAWQGGYSFDEGFVAIPRIPKNHYVATLNVRKAIDEAVYEDPLLVDQSRLHTRAFDLHRLNDEDYDKNRGRKCEEDIPKPGPYLGIQAETGTRQPGL